MSFWHIIGQQLQRPQGRMGHVIGHAMRLLNAKPNSLAISELSIQPSDQILELGFGPGQAIARMAQQVPLGKVYGIDASPTMLAQALQQNKHAIAMGKVSLWLGEFSPLTMADESLDKILAVNVVYFWKNAPNILAECHRVLRLGGKISIYATDASSMHKWKFAGNNTHTLYNTENIHTAMIAGGFTPNDINIKTIKLPTGIIGILAVGQKSSMSIPPHNS
jgi:ubiquinone/menaquinone biosynthesis C-methylase UbiE